MKTVKQLSVRQALNCENAREKTCRCRCGGSLHGAGRASSADAIFALAEDDPHHIFTQQEKRDRKSAEAKARWKKAIDALLDIHKTTEGPTSPDKREEVTAAPAPLTPFCDGYCDA